MPQIICKGLQEQDVQQLSQTVSDALSSIMDTPTDWFIFEHVARTCFVCGEKGMGEPMVDVWWFARGQEVQDKTAAALDNAIRALGYTQIEIAFHPLAKESYYENGQHY